MLRRSWLDGVLERFQHRWETNPQYRAMMSGVLGVVFLVCMCACVGLVSVGAQGALAAMGFAGSNTNTSSADQSSTYTGAKAAHGVSAIPVSTVTLGTPAAIPVASLPASGTPLPTPTLAPTPTDTPTPPPCDSNCGGGRGGGGNSGTVSGNPLGLWRANKADQLHIHTSAPNIGVSVIINNVPGIGTITQFQPAGVTDGNGDLTITYSAPASLGSGVAQATLTADFSPQALATVNIPCAP